MHEVWTGASIGRGWISASATLVGRSEPAWQVSQGYRATEEAEGAAYRQDFGAIGQRESYFDMGTGCKARSRLGECELDTEYFGNEGLDPTDGNEVEELADEHIEAGAVEFVDTSATVWACRGRQLSSGQISSGQDEGYALETRREMGPDARCLLGL